MKRGTIEHPKTMMLSGLLEVERFAAVGILECLWHFTARYAPRGDVGKFSDQVIADAIGWRKDAKQFVQALIQSGWLDEDSECRLLIHDWSEHADDTVNKYLKRSKQRFFDGRKPYDKGGNKSRKCRDKVVTNPCLPSPVPEPSPSPSPSPENSECHIVDPDVAELADLLADRILENHPDNSLSRDRGRRVISWREEIERLIRIDKRAPAEVRAMIEWCQADSFWRANILSAKKLREKWDMLAAQKRRKETKGGDDGKRTGFDKVDYSKDVW